jgi:predicted NACHT family NTPase
MELKFEVTNLISPIINTFKTINDEWDHLFEIGLRSYLQVQTEKFYVTNTFLHRGDKVRFDDIYYPIKAKYKNLTTDFSALDDILDEYRNITIVGTAGSGKTTMMKFIFLLTLREQTKIPLLIELKALNDSGLSFEELVYEKLVSGNVVPNGQILARALKSGKFLFLFDGFDEIFSSKRQEVVRQIELFTDSYATNYFIITSRPGSGIEDFPRFVDFKVQLMDNTDVDNFVVKLVGDEERRKKILETVNLDENDDYTEYLRNPLLLSMFILSFESHPEIPKRRSAFYKNVFDTLYSRHDGVTKSGFNREKKTKLQREDFEKILSVFSYLSFMHGDYVFTEEHLSYLLQKVRDSTDYKFDIEDLIFDLRTTISILILDGLEYSFPHRSLQEYFTAHFLNSLVGDQKIKGYDKLMNLFENSSTDHSYNLWNLCAEMDKTGFMKYFLLKLLESYESSLTIGTDTEILERYIRMTELSFVSRPYKGADSESTEIAMFRTHNLNSSVLQYCLISIHNKIVSFPRERNIELELASFLPEGFTIPKQKDLPIKFTIAVNRLLIKNGIVEVIKSMALDITNRIREFEIELDNEKKSVDDLLNFTD